jgi:hypothetical protein
VGIGDRFSAFKIQFSIPSRDTSLVEMPLPFFKIVLKIKKKSLGNKERSRIYLLKKKKERKSKEQQILS